MKEAWRKTMFPFFFRLRIFFAIGKHKAKISLDGGIKSHSLCEKHGPVVEGNVGANPIEPPPNYILRLMCIPRLPGSGPPAGKIYFIRALHAMPRHYPLIYC